MANTRIEGQTEDKESTGALKVLKKWWIPIIGVFSLALLFIIGGISSHIIGGDPEECLKSVIRISQRYLECENSLSAAVHAAVERDTGTTFSPEISSLFKWACKEAPRGLIWFDNLAVDMYTLFFIAAYGAAYKRILPNCLHYIGLRRTLLTISCILALFGALSDHSENFWLLAHMSTEGFQHRDYSWQLPTVAHISAWKFRFFFLNIAALTIWGAVACLQERH